MFRTHSLEAGFEQAVDNLLALDIPDVPATRLKVGESLDVVEAMRAGMRPGEWEKRHSRRQWEKIEERGITIRHGVRLLLDHKHVLRRNKLRQAHEQVVTAEDAEQVLSLYGETGLATENSFRFLHHKLTAAFARGITQALSEGGGHQPNPHVLGAMGLLRNVGTFFVRGYRSRELLTHIICGKLGVHDVYRNYLRPLWSSLGPLTSEQYKGLDAPARVEVLGRYCDGIDRQLTTEQRICEFAGFLAKPVGQRIRTFREIQRELQPTRETRATYEKQAGGVSIWTVDEDAHDRLQPEFCYGWARIYDRCYELYGDIANSLRDKFQRQLRAGKL